VSLAVQQFWQGLTVGLLDPLGHLLFGSSAPEIRLGPFNLSPVLSGIVGSFLTIIVGTFSTILALRLSWRIIARALPDDDHRNDWIASTVNNQHAPTKANKTDAGNL